MLYLSRFDFTLRHVTGTKMIKANRLSRRLDQKVGVENNNKNQKIKTRIKNKKIVRVVK